jgi:mannose-1-phosphate guanylyltransferase
MILCAGLGTRLRPLTERWPKAAIPVLGQPLFRYGVAALKRAGASAVGINTHHLADAMETVALAECARAGLRLEIAREPVIQGTAGGIRGMRPFLQDDHFVVLNGDVLFPVELGRLVQSHRQSGALATMVLMPMPAGERYASVEADSSGRVRRIAGRGPGGISLQAWHFTGVHVMSPAVFDFMAKNGPEDINADVYPRILEQDLPIRAEIVRGYWSDLGTPGRYLQTQLDLLAGRAPDLGDASPFSGADQKGPDQWLRRGVGIDRAQVFGPAFFDEDCTVERGAIVGPDVYVGPRARVRSGARLKKCVVLEDTEISSGEDLTQTVAWAGHRLPPP